VQRQPLTSNALRTTSAGARALSAFCFWKVVSSHDRSDSLTHPGQRDASVDDDVGERAGRHPRIHRIGRGLPPLRTWPVATNPAQGQTFLFLGSYRVTSMPMSLSDQSALPLDAGLEVQILSCAGSAVRVVVRGELDLANAPQLGELLSRAYAQVDEVVLDLSGIHFIDSSGLCAILSALRETQRSGKRLAISSALAPQARRLFELAGVAGRLPLVDG
jgi:anti-sigma B factor antagonist